MKNKILITLTSLCILLAGCGKKAAAPTAEQIAVAIDAALNGNPAAIAAALEKGIPVDQTDDYGNSLLMLASFDGHTEIAEMLLKNGADIAFRNPEGRTALMFASTGPYPATVRLLLKHGAEVNAVDSAEHFTPVMFAAAEGLSPVVDILIEAGADLTLKDIDGDTAANFARQRGFTALADRLDGLRASP